MTKLTLQLPVGERPIHCIKFMRYVLGETGSFAGLKATKDYVYNLREQGDIVTFDCETNQTFQEISDFALRTFDDIPFVIKKAKDRNFVSWEEVERILS